MQILWWLAPPLVATALAMLWVSWLGREGRGRIDPEVAARRMDRAMSRPSRVKPRATSPRPTSPGERSSGIAVRSSSRPSTAHPSAPVLPEARPAEADPESTRRAS